MSDLRGLAVIVESLTRLAAGRGGSIDDVQMDVYAQDLARFAPDVVQRACERWRTVPRKDYEPALPDVGRLIQTIQRIAQDDADAEQARHYLPEPVRHEDEPTFVCRECCDGYWREFYCQGAGQLRSTIRHARHEGIPHAGCGRRQLHGPHRFVERCHCVDTNPVVQRQLQRQRARVNGAQAAA